MFSLVKKRKQRRGCFLPVYPLFSLNTYSIVWFLTRIICIPWEKLRFDVPSKSIWYNSQHVCSTAEEDLAGIFFYVSKDGYSFSKGIYISFFSFCMHFPFLISQSNIFNAKKPVGMPPELQCRCVTIHFSHELHLLLIPSVRNMPLWGTVWHPFRWTCRKDGIWAGVQNSARTISF